MKPQLIFVYESHNNIIPTLAIQQCIPFLREWGISGFGIENPSDKPAILIDETNLEQILEKYDMAIRNISNPNPQYQHFITEMLSATGYEVSHPKGRLQALHHSKQAFMAEAMSNKTIKQIVDALKCEAFSFDLATTQSLHAWTPEELMHKRDTAMAQNIRAHSNHGSKMLILVGAAHHPVAEELSRTGQYEISEIFFDDTYDKPSANTYETRAVEALRHRMQLDSPNTTYIQTADTVVFEPQKVKQTYTIKVASEPKNLHDIYGRVTEKLQSFFTHVKKQEESLTKLTTALLNLEGNDADEVLKQEVEEFLDNHRTDYSRSFRQFLDILSYTAPEILYHGDDVVLDATQPSGVSNEEAAALS